MPLLSLGCIPSRKQAGKGSLTEPLNLSQLISTQHSWAQVLAEHHAGLNLNCLHLCWFEQLKLLGNKKDESTCFPEKLMALEIETWQFLWRWRRRDQQFFSPLCSANCSVVSTAKCSAMAWVVWDISADNIITHAGLNICKCPLAVKVQMNCKMYAQLLMYGTSKCVVFSTETDL